MARPRVWTCQRVTAGQPCRTKNPRIKRNCVKCGKPRPKTRQPAHMTALELSYEQYVELNGGDHCGICGVPRPSTRRLDRDHCHEGEGRPRGLLCHRCNRALARWVSVEWLRAAIVYLERDTAPPGVRAVTPLDERRAA